MFSPVLCIYFNLESGYVISKLFILLLFHYGKVDVVKWDMLLCCSKIFLYGLPNN